MRSKDLTITIHELASPLQVVLRPYQLVSDVLIFLQISRSKEKIFYFYVVDENDKLIGVVSSRKLLFSAAHESISSIMDRNVIALKEEDSLEKALELFSHHQLLSFPIVDEERVLKGYVDIQTLLGESLDAASAQRKQDVFQLVGLHLEEGRKASTKKSYFARMPWLFCNLFGGFACAMISDFNSAVIAKYLVLAMFLPLVLSLSESVTMQTVMQVLLLLRKSAIPLRRYIRMFVSELKVVILLAFSCALVVALLSPLWGEGFHTSFAIGGGIFISIILSASFGAFLPIYLHRKELDPKIASGPVVLMLADVGTTVLYLSLASLFLL